VRVAICSKELLSLICNYYSQSIHTGVAAFDYTPAPIEPFRILPSHRHGLLYHIRNSRLAPQFPGAYATSLIFPAEFSSPLEGYEGVTAQCHNCGNWSAHCITRWCVPLPGPEQLDLTMRRPWFTVCFIVSDSTTLTTETATI
jgi:hypothetical protein